jgi:multidrug efflux pump subunit AcrA (membrane-fusion protein)
MSKKWIIGIAVVVVFVLGVMIISGLQLNLAFLEGEREPAKLGDLIIPVTATGTIQANRFVTIKSKASGQVDNINVVEGQMVNVGDVLVELDPVDEKRNVEAREAAVDRARSAFEKAKVTLEMQKRDLPLQTLDAEARRVDAEARLEDAEFKWERVKKFAETNVATDVEVVSTKSAYLSAKASRDLAKVAVDRARNNEELLTKSAQEDVAQAEAGYRQSQKDLDEAQLRLDETTIRSRSSGMVHSIVVHQGEMIQSGTTTFTGGTPLMTVADIKAVYVIAQVDEADIGAIRMIAPDYARPGSSVKKSDDEYGRLAQEQMEKLEGRTVEVTVDAYRTQTFHGVIERILPEPQQVNNALAFNVRVRLVGEELDKLIGHQADLSFTTEKLEQVVLVKNEALHSEGRDCYVYIPETVSGSQRHGEKKIPVKIGATDGTFTEIVSGLEPGQEVWIKRPKFTDRERREQGLS